MPIIHSVGREHLELGFYPTSDFNAIAQIALSAGIPILLGDVCKVSVNFVFRPLTDEILNEKLKYPGNEPVEQLDISECLDPDHI